MNGTCNVDECGFEGRIIRGVCGRHYQSMIKSGELTLIPRAALEDVWDRVVVTSTGCIEWTGAHNEYGYGILRVNRRNIRAHRATWELTNGPIPKGMVICHKCDNPPCCNVDHLFLGTLGDNSRDMASKGRGYWQQKTHCPQGHPYDEVNTVVYDGRRRCQRCIKDQTHDRYLERLTKERAS